ncbi:MAG: alpha/beta hydrolase [Candidatus Dormiibacterota bacterium]
MTPGENGTVQDHVDAGGVRTYYEAEGSGEPILMLHGGLCAIETFGGLRAQLAQNYRVYLPERRGTGRTPDVDGAYHYEAMAQDTIAFMDAVGLTACHVLGFSDGANVGMIIALQRPEFVRTQVFIGGNINHDGDPPEAKGMLQMDKMPHEALPPMLHDLYAAVSPDGADHWDVVVDKTWKMIQTEPTMTLDDLRHVATPTLMLFGEQDMVTAEYAAEMQAALPNSKLIIVPGASHGLPMEQPDVVARHVVEFLAGAST